MTEQKETVTPINPDEQLKEAISKSKAMQDIDKQLRNFFEQLQQYKTTDEKIVFLFGLIAGLHFTIVKLSLNQDPAAMLFDMMAAREKA